MTFETRHDFHEGMAAMEREVVAMGRFANGMLEDAVRALLTKDAELARRVTAADDELDERYLEVERRWLTTMALQTPVASDLRLMSLILHSNHSIERIGDQAVSLAGAVTLSTGLPSDDTVLRIIGELGERIRPAIRVALEALEQRDLAMALSLPAMMRPVHHLAKSMVAKVTDLRDDPELLEWGIRMVVVARNLERAGARAVDIAEQVAFLLSGVFREFTSEDWDPQSILHEE